MGNGQSERPGHGQSAYGQAPPTQKRLEQLAGVLQQKQAERRAFETGRTQGLVTGRALASQPLTRTAAGEVPPGAIAQAVYGAPPGAALVQPGSRLPSQVPASSPFYNPSAPSQPPYGQPPYGQGAFGYQDVPLLTLYPIGDRSRKLFSTNKRLVTNELAPVSWKRINLDGTNSPVMQVPEIVHADAIHQAMFPPGRW
ncbi:hypothetical protein GNI_138870 [Gregarina niphandrodes]|uniref:Uncharacterized protein n=1 Tax=Gregarina niphandrodes TaxID=110365 RepID=A0A023B0K5_GRENI|nr:hypothetical protein GNI_138870 [Gregarina niphandrodes]EZG45373.1 hypothetical protein GNI_138870 [Gregarina niphandrodes]|eukprot:XP_011132510.1 hypothetical protein GNI_138870 [Gregarina niphandrodes]